MNRKDILLSSGRIRKNTGFLLVANILSKFFTLAFFAIAARYIGPEGFGKFSFALSLAMMFIALGDLGLSSLGIRDVAKDISLAGKYISNIVILKLILSIIAVGLLFLSVICFKCSLDVVKTIYIIGFSMFFVSMSSAFRWYFQASEEMEYEALITISQGVLLLAVGILVLRLGGRLMGLAYSYLFTSILIFCFSFLIIFKKFIGSKFEIDRNFCKFLVKAALPIGLVTFFSVMVYPNINIVMLSFIKGDEPVGWYNAAYKLIDSIKLLPSTLTVAMFPVMSQFHKNSLSSFEKILKKATKILFVLMLPLGIGGMILSHKIIMLIYGAAFVPASFVFGILSWLVILDSYMIIYTNCLVAINKERLTLLVYGVAIGINIILNLFLIPKFSYIGVSVAILVSEFIALILTVFFIFQKVKVNLLPPRLVQIVIASVIMGIFTWVIKDFNIILVVTLSAIFYFFILILIKGINRNDLKLLTSIEIFGRGINDVISRTAK